MRLFARQGGIQVARAHPSGIMGDSRHHRAGVGDVFGDIRTQCPDNVGEGPGLVLFGSCFRCHIERLSGARH